jgi:hypothetical protein
MHEKAQKGQIRHARYPLSRGPHPTRVNRDLNDLGCSSKSSLGISGISQNCRCVLLHFCRQPTPLHSPQAQRQGMGLARGSSGVRLIRAFEEVFDPLGLTALAIQVFTGLWMGWIYLRGFQNLFNPANRSGCSWV